MDLMEVIYSRRSVRKFTDQPIERDALEKLLDAARWAPNGGNRNAWRFVVVTSRGQKRLLLRFAPGIGEEPAAIVVICMASKQKVASESARMIDMADAAIAAQNMALTAHAMGLGSCVVVSFASAAIGTVLGLPDGLAPYLMLTLGHPAEAPEPPPRRAIDEIAFLDEYGQEWTT